jgi:hypothetical protein
MIWVIVGSVAVVFLLVLVLRRPRRAEPPLDPESVMQSAVELYRIRRRLDVAYTKAEQRRDAEQLRRRIGQILDDDGA